MQQELAGDELIFGYASVISSLVVRVGVERKHGFMMLETQSVLKRTRYCESFGS